jgi:hypothetical protein
VDGQLHVPAALAPGMSRCPFYRSWVGSRAGLRQNIIQGDQNVSVHLMIIIQSSGAYRLFNHPVIL